MENIIPYIWVAVIVVSVIAEALSASLVAIWFMPSAIIAMILAFCKVPIYLQVIIFLVLSVLFILFSRKIFRKTLHAKPIPTNADSLIGTEAVVCEKISNLDAKGLVKIRGQIWSARSADGDIIDAGETVSIISIEGVKLICRKINKETNKEIKSK